MKAGLMKAAAAAKARAKGAPSQEIAQQLAQLQHQVRTLTDEKEMSTMQLDGMKGVIRDHMREIQELKEAAPDGGAAFSEANELRIKLENVERSHAVDLAELNKKIEASEIAAAEGRAAAASAASSQAVSAGGADVLALQQQLSERDAALVALKAAAAAERDEARAAAAAATSQLSKAEAERERERSNKSVAESLLVEKTAELDAATAELAERDAAIAALRDEKTALQVAERDAKQAHAALQSTLEERSAAEATLLAEQSDLAAQLAASEEQNRAAVEAADAAASAAAEAAAAATAERAELTTLRTQVEALEDAIEDSAVQVKIQAKQRNKLIKELKTDLGKQHKRLKATEGQLVEAAEMKVKWEDLELELAKAKMVAARLGEDLEEAQAAARSAAQSAAQSASAPRAPRIPAASALVDGVKRKLATPMKTREAAAAAAAGGGGGGGGADDGVKAALAQRLRQLLGENENLRERLSMLEGAVQSLTDELAEKKELLKRGARGEEGGGDSDEDML